MEGGTFVLITENMPISKIIEEWTHLERIFEHYQVSTSSKKMIKEEVPSKLLNELLFELNNLIESDEESVEY